MSPPNQKRLWSEDSDEDYDEIDHFDAKNSKPFSYITRQASQDHELRKWTQQTSHQNSLLQNIYRSFVVGQEIALISLVVSFHEHLKNPTRQDDESQEDLFDQRFEWIMFMILGTFAIILYNSEEQIQNPNIISPFQNIVRVAHKRRDQMVIRLMDAILLSGILRFFSSVLRTLTASYSSDTVNALANGGMMIHLLVCDYAYANGSTFYRTNKDDDDLILKQKNSIHERFRRNTFQGGTISLNAAFFSTTLLASRLPTDFNSFAFILVSIIAFAFYPAARHNIAKKSHFYIGM